MQPDLNAKHVPRVTCLPWNAKSSPLIAFPSTQVGVNASSVEIMRLPTVELIVKLVI
jgi:hypothetical protein